MNLFESADFTVIAEPVEVLSAGRRITRRNRIALALGQHPANGLPIDEAHRCGECSHLQREHHGGNPKVFLKCEHHRLGRSFSEASDMRASWPACPLFAEVPE